MLNMLIVGDSSPQESKTRVQNDDSDGLSLFDDRSVAATTPSSTNNDGDNDPPVINSIDDDLQSTDRSELTCHSNSHDINTDAGTSSTPLKICYVVEPSPLTYFCGYAPPYQALFQHILNNHPKDHIQLLTSEAHKPQPQFWPCNKDVSVRDMIIHHTYGIPLLLYPMATMAMDWSQKLFRVLIQLQPDLVHASIPNPHDIPLIIYSRLLGFPLFISYHTHIPLLPYYIFGKDKTFKPKTFLDAMILAIIQILEYSLWLYLHCIHFLADYMVAIGPEIVDEFKNHGMEVGLWEKGIDTERFHPKHFNEAIRNRMIGYRTDNPFLLVHIGRFAVEKRIHLLKQVMDNLPNDVHLCLIGSGPEEQRLKDLFLSSPSTSERVTFMGYMEGIELSQAFASGDVFVMQSDSETLGFVVLESLASGVPVVGVAAGGVKGLINSGITGYLYENGDIATLVELIVQLKNDTQLRQTMSQAARIETLNWSWTSSSTKMRQDLYSKCIHNFNNRYDTRIRNAISKFFKSLTIPSVKSRREKFKLC